MPRKVKIITRDRLEAALRFCEDQKRLGFLKGKAYFVGSIEKELSGLTRIEGYLFNTKAEAYFELQGRLKRGSIIRPLVFGRFYKETVHSKRHKSL